MKRIILCITIVLILFGGLFFFALRMGNEVPSVHTGDVHEKSGHMQPQTSVDVQEASELRSELELQMSLRIIPSLIRETRTQSTLAGCGLVLLLAICASVLSGGRKSSLSSILCIRLTFQDGMVKQLRIINQMDGKKRNMLCFL